LFVLVVLFIALLIAYPWWVLTIGTLCYLACLPLGWLSYRNHERKDAAAVAAAAHHAPAASGTAPGAAPPPSQESERPARLN
jgi:CDP-diacylglycerol--serine O-phosphatidyltransferase